MFEILHRPGEFEFQPVLPTGVERGVNVQAAELDVVTIEHAVQFSPHGL